ncbi:MAG TPA: hypothetical protein VGQ55_11525 [Pyrinomonadaceae bacterium]|nr:hypothetical protein [Pyrinomonadaceae bacterium]
MASSSGIVTGIAELCALELASREVLLGGAALAVFALLTGTVVLMAGPWFG